MLRDGVRASVPPRHHGAVDLQSRKGFACGCDLRDAFAELLRHATASAPMAAIAPTHDRAIGPQGSKSKPCGKHVVDAFAEQVSNATGITTDVGTTPCNHGAIRLQRCVTALRSESELKDASVDHCSNGGAICHAGVRERHPRPQISRSRDKSATLATQRFQRHLAQGLNKLVPGKRQALQSLAIHLDERHGDGPLGISTKCFTIRQNAKRLWHKRWKLDVAVARGRPCAHDPCNEFLVLNAAVVVGVGRSQQCIDLAVCPRKWVEPTKYSREFGHRDDTISIGVKPLESVPDRCLTILRCS
mmetsp:Transcript_21676/g.60535  ORF Transcript_21676/g.60535 Transcript_21676/m.60535 type:complete len:302 (-) Transcript_21676:576-1481(-)